MYMKIYNSNIHTKPHVYIKYQTDSATKIYSVVVYFFHRALQPML
jgi:hypothetical protein